MARPPRFSPPDVPQHVVQRGNNRAAMFARPSDFHAYRRHLGLACEEHGCRVHAYVFMTNHVHLIISPDSADGLGLAIQSLGRRYVPYFNRSSGRTGALWERRYRATLVDTDRYLLACYRYVELNPVRAGMVTDPGDYPWSSYRANAFGSHDALVTPHEQYLALGPKAYRELVGVALDDHTLNEIRTARESDQKTQMNGV